MNAFLRLFGLRTNATRADQVTYWVACVALLVGGAVGAVMIWMPARTFAFDKLNGCVDPRADASQLGEQAYRPSSQYLDCIQGPHRTAFLLGAVVTATILLVVLVVLTAATRYLIFSDFVRLDNKPVSARKVFGSIYRGFGVYALVLLMIVLILVGPRS